jgi:hypothetical protein
MRDELGEGIRLLCGKPTPMKRLVVILVVVGRLTAANFYVTISAIYNIGKEHALHELSLPTTPADSAEINHNFMEDGYERESK